MILQQIIETIFDLPPGRANLDDIQYAVDQLKISLNDGTVRAAEPHGSKWRVNQWIKKGILLAFRIGSLREYSKDGVHGGQYFDKDTMELKRFSVTDNVRIVPGGTAVRDGSYLGKGVVIMPPAYVNIGAYVDEGTMIDSHVLVGSCAQIGKHVHLSAGAQIGGVLEPVGALPVIIEDEVMVGGNCGVYEGTLVQRRAVLAAGVILTGSTPVYDIVKKQVYRKTPGEPLTIPANAVVVPGSRPAWSGSGTDSDAWAKSQHVSLYCPIIVKYRDEKTDAATALEESLR
jgi:2,3,4,5-tetrahydropyridine-2-carboxylate N-succinyltransferase